MPSSEAEAMTKQLFAFRPPDGAPPRALEDVRAFTEQLATMLPPPGDVVLERVDAGGVEAECMVAPGASREHVVLFVHGGGGIAGSVAAYRSFPTHLSKAAGISVLSVEYRLGPENPYPAAIEDCVAVYRHLLDSGTPPDRISIAGDSAGGGIAVATLAEAREAGLPMPAAAVLLSPFLDYTMAGATVRTKAADDPMGRSEDLQACVDGYLAVGSDAAAASPLACSLDLFPPTLIHVGSAETLLDDSLRFTALAQAAGAEVDLRVWEGLFHVFPHFAMLPEAAAATAQAAEFVRGRMHMTPTQEG